MTALALALVVLAAGMLTAALALHRWGWRELPLALGSIALAPALAYGPLSLATFTWSWLGRVGGRLSLIALAAGVAALLVTLTPRRAQLPKRNLEPLPRGVALASVIAGVVALGAVAIAAPALVRARPFGTYDAHAIWNARAVFLHRADGDPSRLFRMMHLGHPDYPLLVPAAIAGQWSLLGREDAAVPQIVSIAFLLGTALVVGTGLAVRHLPFAGCLGVALYLSTPNALRWGSGQCADVPLSYFFVLAAVGCAGLVGSKEKAPLPPVLTGFFVALLPWTKNEGLFLAVLLGGVVTRPWRVHNEHAARTRTWTELAVGMALPLLALITFKLYWSPKNEITAVYLKGAAARFADLSRWETVAVAFLTELNPLHEWQRWGMIWPFALGGCAWSAYAHAARREPARTALALAFFGALAAWFLIYIGGSRDVAWQLRTSLNRLLLQLLPLSLICALDWRAGHDGCR